MDAAPLLTNVAEALAECRLEAILVGNAAAALHGAPVTTIDIDFMFRRTRTNMRKLKSFSTRMNAVILKPYYPASDLFRIINDERGLQIDFMTTLHGIRSFEGLRSRAVWVRFGDAGLWVANLSDIIKSKEAANRPQDRAVIEILNATLEEKTNQQGGST